jgi:hypothetical protein
VAVFIVGVVIAFIPGIFSEHAEDVGQVVGDVQQELVGAEAEVDIVNKLLDDFVSLKRNQINRKIIRAFFWQSLNFISCRRHLIIS